MVFLALDRVIWGPAENQLMEEGILNLIYIEIILPNKLRPAKIGKHHTTAKLKR